MITPEESICHTANRRRNSRIPVKPLVYLTKTTDTPGFLLNLSESGMAIQAMVVMALATGSQHILQFVR